MNIPNLRIERFANRPISDGILLVISLLSVTQSSNQSMQILSVYHVKKRTAAYQNYSTHPTQDSRGEQDSQSPMGFHHSDYSILCKSFPSSLENDKRKIGLQRSAYQTYEY